MTGGFNEILEHYAALADRDELFVKLEQFLGAIEPPLTAEKLAGLDQFHVRGLAATKQLAEIAGVEAPMHVFDAGSGLGGPSRFLAEIYGCRVTGMDVSPLFVAIARLLANRAGLD